MKEDNELKFNSVLLESDFLIKHLKSAESDFLKIYIYIKALGKATTFDVSKNLSIPLSKVYDAIEFWSSNGVLEETDGSIKLVQMKVMNKKVRFDERPEYDPMELQMYADKNPEVKILFGIAQKYLGRLLTHNDLSGIFGLHSWLGLSIPVIEKLLTYCVENNHRNMRYIEKVAIDWVENNITTPEAAEEKLKMYNVDFRRIMKAMGQSNRNPITKEEQFMTAWIKELKLPIEVIELACEKAVLNTGKAAFGYANKILLDWKEANVKNVEEAYALESKFKEDKKEAEKTQKAGVSGQKKNKFVNFEQRSYDFDAYERMEFERISKKQK